MPVIPVYAAILGLLFVVLSINTIRARIRLRIAIGLLTHFVLGLAKS
jgi:uncharacterized membrane protein YecN with MAPEG domain